MAQTDDKSLYNKLYFLCLKQWTPASSFLSGSHAADGLGKAWVTAAWNEFSLDSWCHLVEKRMLEGGQGRLQSWPPLLRPYEQCWGHSAAEAVCTDKEYII